MNGAYADLSRLFRPMQPARPRVVAYLVDTHAGAMSQLVACSRCAEPYYVGPAEDCQPLTLAELAAIHDAEETPDEEPMICEFCGFRFLGEGGI